MKSFSLKKIFCLLVQVDRRYSHYCEQMQMVVNSFDLVLGFGAAMPVFRLLAGMLAGLGG